MFAQEGKVCRDVSELVDLEPASYSAQQGLTLVAAEIIAGPKTEQREHASQCSAIQFFRRRLLYLVRKLEALRAVTQRAQLRWYFRYRKNQVHHRGIDRAARHIPVFGV